jgi:orotidine-5'-phosphate decarboxylase
MVDPRIIVALDYASPSDAEPMLGRLSPKLCKIKIGKELFTAAGPAFVESTVGRGFQVFLDLKFHDIPRTVAKACLAAARLGVWMINVHASGGRSMMLAAREALEKLNSRPRLIAVTVLTSLDRGELVEVGVMSPPDEQVSRLARLARDCGLDGVVCSGREAEMLRQSCGTDFLLVTPGIRPAGADHDDQKRVLTPLEAMNVGADYLVIGRPVTRAADPQRVLHEIIEQMQQGESK